MKPCDPPCPPELCREWTAQGMCSIDKVSQKTLSHLKGLAQNRQVKFRETPGKKLDLSKCKVKLGE